MFFGVEYISIEILKIRGNKNSMTNVHRMQAYDNFVLGGCFYDQRQTFDTFRICCC